MRKRLIYLSVFAALLMVLCSVAAVWHDNIALAKKQTVIKLTPAERMARYSVKKNNKTATPIRRSHLTQINVITETAKVLGTLPINIIDQMKKGKTLVQIAKEKGLTKAQFLKKLTDLDNQNVTAAVNSGKISKKQGDALKQGQTDRLKNNLNLKAVDVNDHQAMDMNH